MREVITVSIGRSDNHIAAEFWPLIAKEHGIDSSDGNTASHSHGQTHVCFHETLNQQGETSYLPRAFFIDETEEKLDVFRQHNSLSSLVSPDSFISCDGYGLNFFERKDETVEQTKEQIRHATESCDQLEGFQFLYSTGGLTGYMISSLLSLKVLEEFPDRMLSHICIFPSSRFFSLSIEPYNTLLALHNALEWAFPAICIDQETLYSIYQRQYKNRFGSPEQDNHDAIYPFMNAITAQALSHYSSWFRYPCSINNTIRRMSYSLVPFPGMHFLSISLAPIYSSSSNRIFSVPSLSQMIMNKNYNLLSHRISQGNYVAASFMFRGAFLEEQVETEMAIIKNKHEANFVPWIPDNINSAVCSCTLPGVPFSASLLGNDFSIQQSFSLIYRRFDELFRRKAFLHRMNLEWADEGELMEARENINDLIHKYQMY